MRLQFEENKFFHQVAPTSKKQLKYFSNGTFLQQLECGYGFPALIHVWIASAGVLEWFISTSGFATSACKPF